MEGEKRQMTEWSSEQQRETAVRVMQILSRTRKNKRGLKRKLEYLRDEKGVSIYKTDSDIEETIDELLENPEIPVKRSDEGNFFERTDQGVTY